MKRLLLALLMGFLALPAMAQNVGSSGASGPITPTHITVNGTITSPAAPVTAGNNWLYNVNNINGTQTGNNQFSANYLGVNDSLNTNSNVGANIGSLWFQNLNLTTNFTGNRQNGYWFLNVTGVPSAGDTSGHIYVDGQFTAQVANNVGGFAPNLADAVGSLWSGDDNSICTAACTNLKEIFGREIDVGIAAGGSAVRRMGLDIVINANGAVKGSILDAGLSFGAKTGETSPWVNGIVFGNEAAVWAFDSSSCLICIIPRLSPTTTASAPADRGIDFRPGTFTTGPLMTPNAGFDGSGNGYGGDLFIGSTLTAKNGSVASIAAVAKYGLTGGAYFGLVALPTISISAPPNSGTPATATVTHVQLTQAPLVTGTDVGCTNGDVLTVTSSGTGTQATLTLTVVGGAVTAVAITTPGDLTSAPGASPGTTGGTCSVQPTIHLGYGVKTVAVGTAGTQYPVYPLPFILVTGSSSAENTPALLQATMSTAVAPLNLTGSSIVLTGVTTGTNADFLCMAAGGTITIQASACTISSRRFKTGIKAFADIDALHAILALEPSTFRLKGPNLDPNAHTTQVGLIAEDVAATDSKCAIYERDMRTPKSWRQECVIAQLVGAVKAQQVEIAGLKTEIQRLERR